MKSILLNRFLFMACLMFVTASALQAQKHCDLSLHVISPAVGAEIPYGDTVHMVVSVKNLGPDDIDSTDGFVLNMANSPFGIHFVDVSIPVGDSLVYEAFRTLSGQSDSDFRLVVCPYIVADLNTYVDDNPFNDSACMDVVLKVKENTGISTHFVGEQEVRLYPNPARDRVFLKMTLSRSTALSVRVQNIFGHTVATAARTAVKGENNLPLNIRHLAPGLYFVNVVASDGQSWVEKLMVQ